jgi:hypothetical protein
MRDPSRYLLGVYGSYHTWNDIDIWRAAGEVELYHGPVSFSGLAGIQGVDQAATDSSHLFGQFDLSYYPTEDLKLAAGYSYENETSLGTIGVEYLMHKSGGTPVSLFAKGRFGASDYQSITGGLKVHFGADPDASLMARNRTADPENYTPIFPATNSGGGGGVCGDVRAEYPDGSCTCPEGTNPSETDHGTFYCKRPT